MKNIKLLENFDQPKNYMFFQNLMVLKDLAEQILDMPADSVDSLLSEHPWAVDHVATSKDDVEEVFGFLKHNHKK